MKYPNMDREIDEYVTNGKAFIQFCKIEDKHLMNLFGFCIERYLL